jgi:hypothetical protein
MGRILGKELFSVQEMRYLDGTELKIHRGQASYIDIQSETIEALC